MTKQTIGTAFKRFSLLSKNFYSPMDLFPWERGVIQDDFFTVSHSGLTLTKPTITGGTSALQSFNQYPVNIMGGYGFGASCDRPIMTGIFSPHNIIQPSRETVDLKAYVWWLGPYVESAAASRRVNWIANLVMSKDATPSNQILTPLCNIVNSMIVPNDLMAPVSLAAPLSNPVAQSASNGNPSWRYSYDIVSGGTVDKLIAYPYSQWAVGGESTVVASTDLNSLTGLMPVAESKAPVCFYRTPLNFVSWPSPPGGAFVADSTVSFKDFSELIDNETIGFAINLWRWSPAVEDGDLIPTNFAPEITADNDTTEFYDAIFGFIAGWPTMIPVFIGMEFEIM